MDRPLPPVFIPEHGLLRRIGVGSAGDVWLARDSLGNWRAVKLVTPRADGDETVLRRELAGLRRFEPVSRGHPALLDILFAGTDPATGTLFYVMELADDAQERGSTRSREGGFSNPPASAADTSSGRRAGKPPPGANGGPENPPTQLNPDTYQPDTLSRRLRQAANADLPQDRRLPAAEVLSLARQLAAGLAHLHTAGLIHRDVKPGNVVFVAGRPCLADCGLVSVSAVARSFVGTEGFIPPEGPGSPSADIYALGKVLYEAAFGMDRNDWPELPAWFGIAPDLPLLRELLAVMRRACATDLAARYRDADGLLADLELLTEGGSVMRRGERQGRWRRLIVAVLLSSAVAGFMIWRAGRSPLVAENLSARLDDLQDVQPVDAIPQSPAQLEFYAINGKQVQLFNAKGEVITTWSPPDNPLHALRLGWLPGAEGDGSMQRCVSWSSRTNCVITLPSDYGNKELRRFTTPGLAVTNSGGALVQLSVIRAELVGDLDGDGRLEMVASLASEPSHLLNVPPLRQIVAFDFASGARKWAVEVAATEFGSVVQVTNRSGGVALLAGGPAPDNGHRLPDGMDDSHSHLYALSAEGRLLWHRETGDIYTRCLPQAITWPAEAVTEIYVRAWGEDDFRPDHTEVGRIIRFNSAGRELGRFEAGHGLNSWTVTDLAGNGVPEIFATDSQGILRVLDRELNVCRTVELVRRRLHRVEFRFVGEGDLDGDGKPELVFTAAQCQPLIVDNFGDPAGKQNYWHYEDIEVLVLDRRLNTVARHRVADQTERNPGELARLFDLDRNGRPLIVVLGVQPQLLRWRR